MSLKLWLAQPENERKLGAWLRGVAAVIGLWALAVGYGLWSTRATLAAARSAIISQNKQIVQIGQEAAGKRRLAAKAAEVKLVASEGAGSSEITEELVSLAHLAGADAGDVRLGGGNQAPASAKAAPADAAASSATASTDGGWTSETFECSVAGGYAGLSGFLDGLAASRHVLDITSFQITTLDAKAHPEAPRLQMKLDGIVYETPGTS
jgi:hypothetical protein